MISGDHAARDVDRQRQPGAPDRQTMKLIDDKDIELRMIDLHDLQRVGGIVGRAHRPKRSAAAFAPSRSRNGARGLRVRIRAATALRDTGAAPHRRHSCAMWRTSAAIDGFSRVR